VDLFIGFVILIIVISIIIMFINGCVEIFSKQVDVNIFCDNNADIGQIINIIDNDLSTEELKDYTDFLVRNNLKKPDWKTGKGLNTGIDDNNWFTSYGAHLDYLRDIYGFE